MSNGDKRLATMNKLTFYRLPSKAIRLSPKLALH